MSTNNNSQVNGQITDAVTQSNVSVVAEAPAQALGSLYQVASHSSGIAMQNAVSNQNNLSSLNSTLVAKAIGMIMAAGPSPSK